MSEKEQKLIAVLTQVKGSTVPSKEGFEAAFAAIPEYHAYVQKGGTMPERIMFPILADIMDIAERILGISARELRSARALTASGLSVVVEHAMEAPRYIAKLCTKTFTASKGD